MEKIASVIGIKNITWSETRTHASGHKRVKGNARREVLDKSPAFAEARVRYAIYHLTCRMGISPDKLRITEAWSASNVDSKIMWIEADRETITLLKNVKAEAHRKQQTIDIEFMEFMPRNHQQIRNDIKERCNKLRTFNKYWWTKVVPGEPGNPNYQIEVSRRFIRVDYDLFMSIPLDESGPF